MLYRRTGQRTRLVHGVGTAKQEQKGGETTRVHYFCRTIMKILTYGTLGSISGGASMQLVTLATTDSRLHRNSFFR